MINYKTLRKKHPCFIYESFRWSFKGNDLFMRFRFKLEPNIIFEPKVVVKNMPPSAKKIPGAVLDNFVFHLGLAEIPSYWKCAVSPSIEIKAGHLNKNQIKWWKKLLTNGLAEFFYVNHINPDKTPFQITSTGENNSEILKLIRKKNIEHKFLVMVGGGKDSLVAIKLVKTAGGEIGTFVLGNVKASISLVKSFHLKPPIKTQRVIDKKLIELNKNGYLNGHTPFSSYLAFLSTFCAEVFGYDTVIAGNERSANEPSMLFNGKKVNHQYSKSYEFEKDFRGYIKKYLTENVNYLSILRPIYEIQIAKLAAKFTENIGATRSCNVKLKENLWCGKCPKCLSIFLLLYPFLDTTKLKKMFGENLFENKKLWSFIPELTGIKTQKPFECVATRRENIAALILGYKKCKNEKKGVPYILRRFHETIEPKAKMNKKNIDDIMNSWNVKNFLPPSLIAAYSKVAPATKVSLKKS